MIKRKKEGIRGSMAELQSILKMRGYSLHSQHDDVASYDENTLQTTQKWKKGSVFSEIFCCENKYGKVCTLFYDETIN